MTDTNKLNSASARLIHFDRSNLSSLARFKYLLQKSFVKIIKALKFTFKSLLLAVSSRIKKFLLGVGLGLAISSIVYLFGVFLYRDYSPIYLSSLNPLKAIASFAIGSGFLSVIIGESFLKKLINDLEKVIDKFFY